MGANPTMEPGTQSTANTMVPMAPRVPASITMNAAVIIPPPAR